MPYTGRQILIVTNIRAGPPLTIRKILLLAFLLVSLLPSILLTYLSFRVAGDAMRDDIEKGLQVEAGTISQDIDEMLFERLQNALTWSRLEVMQEIQVKDVDKRLANFLDELKSGYRDVYTELLCSDAEGYIVASSLPANIGKRLAAAGGITLSGWNETTIDLDRLYAFDSAAHAILPIHIAVPSKFKQGSIGELRLLFNWKLVDNILDEFARNGSMALVVDAHGGVIAASSAVRERVAHAQRIPLEAMRAGDSGIITEDGAYLGLNEITIGYARSRGFGRFPGFGWTTLVIQPSQQAFIPVRHMASVFLLLLAVTSLLAMGVSLLVAGYIARPITELTNFTRRFMHTKQLPEAPGAGGGEVGDLTRAFVQTVHELDQSRQDLVRASKLAVLGEMAAALAHEIRTPIGILRSSAQMLAREPNLGPEARELTGFIESETERLNRLVTTLLDSTRSRPPDLQHHDLHALIHRCLGLLASQAHKKDIQLEEHLEAADPDVVCDGEQMTQVILNLVLNAIQILPTGGRVSVGTRQRNTGLIIEVADNGPGISAEARAKLFDAFFTRREGGVGLGLAVVQQILSAHGGTIEAGTSTLGGALFSISLPRAPNEEYP